VNIPLINFSFFLILSITPAAESSQPTGGNITLADKHHIIIEIADTPELRKNGLMHRTLLQKDHGMLFVYPMQAEQGVWMKNTLIPLDVIFISADNKIVAILENLPPCYHDPCPVYSSTAQAKYMLEIQAGSIAEKTIKIGQTVMIDYAHHQ
jgi:uncharacterized membrane protein (UPF0127 family)